MAFTKTKLYKLLEGEGFDVKELKKYGATKNKLFHLRFFEIKDDINQDVFEIELGKRGTFDRWANSHNFKIEIPKCLKQEVEIKTALEQARKICKIIDFNSYGHQINLQWKVKNG